MAKTEKNIPRLDKAWRLNKVTQQLHDVGSSPSEVARLENVSPAHVTKVCKGESKSARIQQRIESIVGKPWDQIRAA